MGRLLKGSNATNAENKLVMVEHSLRDYAYPGQSRKVEQQIVDMALNGSGIRDTAREISGGIIPPETLSRVLYVSTSTVIKELKKQTQLQPVNLSVLKQRNCQSIVVDICLFKPLEISSGVESELDEMWSFVTKKSNQRWLWHAIELRSGKVLAYVFGTRSGGVLRQLKALLDPFGITRFYTDDWKANFATFSPILA